MSMLKTVTPFVLCEDLKKQISFYADVLGFRVGYLSDHFALMQNGGVSLRLVEVPAREDGKPVGTDQAFYIDVEDVDALYVHYKPQLKGLTSARVKTPFDRSYGQREFHIMDEDGAEIRFGSSVRHD